MTDSHIQATGCGIGLRREFQDELIAYSEKPIDFLEIAPENWLGIGGNRHALLRAYREQYPIVCHGLSLSIGGPAPLDESFILRLKAFFKEFGISDYSEHLSYCSDQQGQLYDLLPMPFTEEAVHHVASRVKRVQELLDMPIALENVSYYTPISTELSELDFINAVLQEADCGLLLDVNNIYVNSVNHQYDPVQFLEALPGDRVSYIHVAGHYKQAEDLLIDTHGAPVTDPVWALLAQAYELHGKVPTLLERDNDVPDLSDLLAEAGKVQSLQANCRTHEEAANYEYN